MQVIVTRSMIFTNPVTHETLAINKTAPGAVAQVPDWVLDDQYFQACESSGWVKEVIMQSPVIDAKATRRIENSILNPAEDVGLPPVRVRAPLPVPDEAKAAPADGDVEVPQQKSRAKKN